jgi:serine/threonine protein kinase
VLLELVAGGEMLDHVVRDGAFTEADAARLMRQLASALAFLHQANIFHADLKPENILMSSHCRQDGDLKLIDFGCAVVQGHDDDNGAQAARPTKKHVATADSTGTTAYWAPERFQKGLTCTASMDMWAVGVIMYIMLNALHPFDLSGTATDAEIEAQLCKDPSPPLDEKIVGHLSESAVDLLSRLMEKDPEKRMTAKEMLDHPWMTGHVTNQVQIKVPTNGLTRTSTFLLARGNESCLTGNLL